MEKPTLSYRKWQRPVRYSSGISNTQICWLYSLQYFDLSHNELSGDIPECFEITLYFVDPHLHKDVKGLHLLLPLMGKEMMKKMETIFGDHISWEWALDLLLDFRDCVWPCKFVSLKGFRRMMHSLKVVICEIQVLLKILITVLLYLKLEHFGIKLEEEEESKQSQTAHGNQQKTCYKCHNLGHYAFECPLKNKRKDQNKIYGEAYSLLWKMVEASKICKCLVLHIGRLKTYEERIKYKGKQVDNQDRLLFTRYEEQRQEEMGHMRSNQSQGKKKITATITIAIIEESQSDWKWKEIPSTSNLSDIKQQEFRNYEDLWKSLNVLSVASEPVGIKQHNNSCSKSSSRNLPLQKEARLKKTDLRRDGILRAPEIPTHVEEDSQSPGAYQWNFWAADFLGLGQQANKPNPDPRPLIRFRQLYNGYKGKGTCILQLYGIAWLGILAETDLHCAAGIKKVNLKIVMMPTGRYSGISSLCRNITEFSLSSRASVVLRLLSTCSGMP
ncbi:zinc finger, CCHC-type containing protein [Tanacetum coccineum]